MWLDSDRYFHIIYTSIFAESFLNLQLLPFGNMHFLLSLLQILLGRIDLSHCLSLCDQSQVFLILIVIKYWVSLVLVCMFTKLITTFYARRIILIDCVIFMWEWNKCVFQSHLCINIRGKKNFDGLVFIYQPLTPTLLMLDIYTSWLVNFYLCFFFQLFCTNLSMHQLLFSLCCENFF